MKRALAAVGALLLSVPCVHAQSSPVGLWRLTRFTDLPKEHHSATQPTQLAFLRMMPDGKLLYVYAVMDNTWDIKPGNMIAARGGWTIWRGTWSLCGKEVCIDRTLIYSDSANTAGQSRPYVCAVRDDHVKADWRGEKMTVLPNVQNGMRSHEESLKLTKGDEDFDKLFGKYLLTENKKTQIEERCGPVVVTASGPAAVTPPSTATDSAVGAAPASSLGATASPPPSATPVPSSSGSRVEEWLRTHPVK
jgi:hypothetical protein